MLCACGFERSVACRFGGVELVADPLPLRAVHRDVRVAQQRADVVAVLRTDRDANTARDLYAKVFERHRLCYSGEQPFGRLRRAAVVSVGQENREFVTAEADEQVLVAQAGVQPSGDNA